MAFSSYAARSDVALAHRIVLTQDQFVKPLPIAISDYLRGELAFVQKMVAFDKSEFAICENLVYPILKEVWKPYAEELQLWCHTPLNCDADLSGIPDYFLARRSPLGTPVIDKPYLMVVEAKRDDFEWGWAQCLAAMVAGLKLNNIPGQIMYGIATNGRTWEFGKVEGNRFTQNVQPFTLFDLDQLCAAINFLFDQCRRQLATMALAS